MLCGTFASLSIWAAAGFADAGQSDDAVEVLQPITVQARRIVNLEPANGFTSTATALRYDPQVDVQTRGLAEGQADVTVRGGLFENTGFGVGAVAIFDPQTGHYGVDIPIAPDQLAPPEVLTDTENSIRGFNASVATVHYGFSRVRDGRNLGLGLGTDGLWYADVGMGQLKDVGANTLGARFSASASRGDGTLHYGDHDFKRFSGQVQYLTDGSETNFMLGYHDKFFGWPGAYTGFSSLPETDHTKVGLVLVDHRRNVERGWWEVGLAYRWLEDDYDFDRRTIESGTPGSYEHETRSFSLGVTGDARALGLDWAYGGQLIADRLVRSTDLTHGDFDSRSYLSLSVAPGRDWQLNEGRVLSARAGARADLSNRDEDALMPLVRLSVEQPAGGGVVRAGIEFTRSSQLPGYTALNSAPSGLFGGNKDLGREYANTLVLNAALEVTTWEVRTTLFRRRDDDLVDWTYRQGAPFARQANPVDLDVHGAELLILWHAQIFDLAAAYNWLDKEADYGSAQVDASFYALNYARRRATLSMLLRPVEGLDVRLDGEYRRQQENPLRVGGNSAFLASFSAAWQLPLAVVKRLRLVVDNVTDEGFQEFPGTPPTGRQVSLAVESDW